MLQTFPLLALAALLLVQYTSCLPPPAASSEENIIPQSAQTTTPAEPVEDTPSNGRRRLVAAVYKNYSNFLNFQLLKTHQIAKDALTDPSMSSIGSKAMENERMVLEKYVKNSKDALLAVLPANKTDQQNRFFFAIGKNFLLEDFNSFARKRSSNTDKLTPEQQISWDILRKHGYVEYTADLENRTKEFTSSLVDEFENYIKSLPPAEKEKEKELVNLWNMYTKNELGVDKPEFGKNLFSVFFQDTTKY